MEKYDMGLIREIWAEYNRNYIWFNSHYNELAEKYGDKYVAVFNEKIAGISNSAKYLNKKCKDMVGVYIDFVLPKGVTIILQR